MAPISLSVAHLLQSRVAITWREAVAVVSAADARSAAEAMPITLEGCCISTEGDVHLSPAGSGQRAVSSLQLLEALLQGQASTDDLRALVVTVGDGSAALEPVNDPDGRLRVDLRWCLGANPPADVARLAWRGLAGYARIAIDPRHPSLVRGRSRAPVERVRTSRRRQAVTVRVQRISPGAALSMAAILLAVATGAAATWMLAAGRSRPAPPPGIADVERTLDEDRPAPLVRPVSSASR